MEYLEYIEENTLRVEATGRGGGIEIDLSELVTSVDSPKMSAYQNYLGGGMLGSIQENHNFDDNDVSNKELKIIYRIAEELKEYFHNLTNHDGDEWESETYEQNQAMPASAY